MHSVLALVTAGLVRSNGITATIQHDAGEPGASLLPPSCDLSGRGPFDRLFEPEILPGAPGQLRALALSNRVTVPDAFVVNALITAGLQFGVQRSTINQPDNQGVVVSGARRVASPVATSDAVPKPAVAQLAGIALLRGGLASASAPCWSVIAD